MATVRLKIYPGELRTGDLVLIEGRYRPWYGTWPKGRYDTAKIVMTAEGDYPDRDLRAATFDGREVLVRRVVKPGCCPHCHRTLSD